MLVLLGGVVVQMECRRQEGSDRGEHCLCLCAWMDAASSMCGGMQGGRERAEEKVTMNIIRAEEYIYSIPHGGLTKTKTLGTSAHNVIPH